MTERVSSALRQEVRRRAEGRCEYCRKPDFLSGLGFHVDHIIPLSHGGITQFHNLAYACLSCNVAKGRDIASIDFESGQLTPLFHPRNDDWNAHFLYEDVRIFGQTSIGRITVRLLEMNHPAQLEIRRDLKASGLWY
jgi:hypothetical protein